MIISVWRYSHLVLAVSSFLLLTLASVTGIVLAVEAVTVRSQPFRAEGLDTITLADAIPVVRKQFVDIQEMKVDDNGFVILDWTNEDGKSQKNYIDPSNGKILGLVSEQPAIYQWSTTLHRSLFLHETGRALVGLTSFLLILIAVSGIALVVQRQQSFRRFFARIENTSFAQYYHVLFGRFALIPILIIALTGTWLSIVRFGLVQEPKQTASVDPDKIRTQPILPVDSFSIFRKTPLTEVQSVQFPFVEDEPEEYFVIKLRDREVSVNQMTGDLLLEVPYSVSSRLTAMSLRLHTGRTNTVWAVILAITCGYILFFIYSGFLITLKRRKNRLLNTFKPEESTVVILVGSENGSTVQYARSVCKQLIDQGQKVHMTDLDNYQLFPAMEHLVIMTSTYGLGDPPSNARNFMKKLARIPQKPRVLYSVLGFGSRTYPDFCRFAADIDTQLLSLPWAANATTLFTVDDRSPQDFTAWCDEWSAQTGYKVHITRELLTDHSKELRKMSVVSRLVTSDEAFLIKVRPEKKMRVQSGDLLAIYPKNDHRERLYSVGVLDRDLQLSVRLHEHGLGSQFLYTLAEQESFRARIIKNQHFHFPAKAKTVVMISNGTGIAPYLGMVHANKTKKSLHLYCGFRYRNSFEQYRPGLEACRADGRLDALHLSLSREENYQYVTHLLKRDEKDISRMISAGAVIMLCGSLSMQRDVFIQLEEIMRTQFGTGIDSLKQKGQLLTDCY